MALKATIYKAQIQLSDMDRHIYEALNITIAQHPSENTPRMMLRLLAYLLNYDEQLSFTKGLCVDEEPEIWQQSLSGEIEHWIDFGLVDEKRIRKACSRAKKVTVYSYGGGFDVWWQKAQGKVSRFDHLNVLTLDEQLMEQMAGLVQRTMTLQCTIDNGEVWLTDGEQSVTVSAQSVYP